MSLLQNVRRGFSFLWRFLDASRRIVVNLLFLALILFILVQIFGGEAKKLDDKTVLVLDLRGNMVEQENASVRQLLLLEVDHEKKNYTQLRDVINVLDAAAQDPKISSMVLLLDDMQDTGLPMMREIAAGLDQFKAKNKKIIAWGSSFNQKQYFLASHADQVYLHPMGMVTLEGFGGYKNYYHDALEKLGITVNVMRVGTFKSFAEPYIANGPSEAATEAENYLYNGLWATYVSNVEAARKLEPGSIMKMINDLPNLVKKENGDLAKLAVDAKLVDGLKTRDELRDYVLQNGGVKDEQINSFRQIDYEGYLARHTPLLNLNGDSVGVIVAEGDISDGISPPGMIGGLSTANLIRKAREDDQIKALVLRVNSPGGSAFGAELIRRELELTRQAGKPVVVSMGNVAASGGYWISMSSDEVFADATTVTGSIGVFAILPTADKAMDKIGVHSGGTTTTWLRGGYDPTRPIDPRFAELVQQSVNHIYSDFIARAAVARKTTPEKLDEVAQGRVWTGQQAKDRGLIDTLGNFSDAIKSAAARAKLGKKYNVEYVEPEVSGFDRLLKIVDVSVGQIVSERFRVNVLPAGVPPSATKQMLKDMRWASDITERKNMFSAVTHCMCSAPFGD